MGSEVYTLVLLLALLASAHCGITKRYVPHYANGVEVGRLSSHSINEASGLCASRAHPGVLYTHNDSGGTSRIFAISATTAARLATITIDGASAHDWEDIACGPCPQGAAGHCIYIADTGGNAGGTDANTIYRIQEPTIDLLHANGQTIHARVESTLKFSWDQHDCETVMVSNTGSIYIVSKVHPGHHPKLVHLPSSAWGTGHHVQVNDGVYIPVISHYDNSPVGGDISADGRETYGHVYYWYAPNGDYYSAMQAQGTAMPYHNERQGESVCFDAKGGNYYTLSEGSYQPLYLYRRTSGASPIG